jgi:hypothetical protein
MPIDPLYITDFNRVRLEFVGHYRDVCENPASSTLWLDVGRESYLDLTYQSLAVRNDLSHFPVPFYDPRDNRPLTLPMVFPPRRMAQQQAAAIVASWFGSKAGWRGQQFPVCSTNCRIVTPLCLPPTISARTSCAIIRRSRRRPSK